MVLLVVAKHPQLWTKEEVSVWLRWCGEEYSIETVPADKFDMNGKGHSVCPLVCCQKIETLTKENIQYTDDFFKIKEIYRRTV